MAGTAWSNAIRVSEAAFTTYEPDGTVSGFYDESYEPRLIPLPGNRALVLWWQASDPTTTRVFPTGGWTNYSTQNIFARVVTAGTPPTAGPRQTVWSAPSTYDQATDTGLRVFEGYWYWSAVDLGNGLYLVMIDTVLDYADGDPSADAYGEVLVLFRLDGDAVTVLDVRERVSETNDSLGRVAGLGGGRALWLHADAAGAYFGAVLTCDDGGITFGPDHAAPAGLYFPNGGLWSDGSVGVTFDTDGSAYPFTVSGTTVTFAGRVVVMDGGGQILVMGRDAVRDAQWVGGQQIPSWTAPGSFVVSGWRQNSRNFPRLMVLWTDGITVTLLDETGPGDYGMYDILPGPMLDPGWGYSDDRYMPRAVLPNGTVVVVHAERFPASPAVFPVFFDVDPFGARERVEMTAEDGVHAVYTTGYSPDDWWIAITATGYGAFVATSTRSQGAGFDDQGYFLNVTWFPIGPQPVDPIVPDLAGLLRAKRVSFNL